MRARGFSLIEMVVALFVSIIAVTAGVVLMVGSHRSFEAGADERAMQETGRVALEELTSSLKEAGYGLEPTFAFDVGPIANTVMDRIPVGKQARFGGYACSGLTCRDRIDGADELVFYSRDPLFTRTVIAIGVGQSSITLGAATPLLRGQILQLMCYGAANQWLWAYVQVASINGAVVNLQPTPGQDYDFPTQNALLAESCFASAGATIRAFKIDRYRYYVQKIDDAGNPVSWTAAARPYLMLDQGLSNAAGPVLTAVAPDVEDLQVAYLYPLASGNARVVGNQPSVRVTAGNNVGDAQAFDLRPTIGIPSFATPSLDPLRTTHHAANVRAVRVVLTVRSPRAASGSNDSVLPAALNRPASDAAEVGFHREQFDTTVYVHAMETRLPVFPFYDTSSNCGSTAGNCGGG